MDSGFPAVAMPGTTIDNAYGFTQSASAGPGELLQVAISLAASLPRKIVPPGQVTETSFSPALHNSSHLVSHAVWVSACRPAVPAGPGGPSGPGGPAGPTPPPAPEGPVTPAGPGRPRSPCGPGGPAGPCGPAGPAAPGGPAAPCGPWAPSKHPVSEKAAISATAAANARMQSYLCQIIALPDRVTTKVVQVSHDHPRASSSSTW